MLHQKIIKILAESELHPTKFPGFFNFVSKFSDFLRSISNSLTFAGFPG